MKKNLGISILVILIGFVLGGCQSVETIIQVDEDNVLTYSIDKLPDTLFNTKTTTDRENDILCSLFDGLVELNENGEIIPSLCEEWSISDNGLEYTFKLKDNVKWSNGDRITSFDFVDYFNYLLSSDNKEYVLDELNVIDGAYEYKNGLSSFESVGIAAIDNKTLEIKLNKVDEDFLKRLSKPVYRLRDVSEPLNEYRTKYSNIRYTGAYTIEEITQNELNIKENLFYIENIEKIKQIKIKEQEYTEADFASYSLGNIDLLYNPPILCLDNENINNKKEVYPSNVIKTLIFNTEGNVVSDSRFREGFFYCMYLEILNSYTLKYNLGTWAFNDIKYSSILNKSLELNKEYNIDEKESFIEKANSLLNKLDTRKKVIKLIAKNTTENKIICNFIADILKENYDINSEVSLLEDEELYKCLEMKNFDIYVDDFDLNNYELDNCKDLSILQNDLQKEYCTISLYFKNFIWSKGDRIEKLFIDSNGNLIFKNSY